MARQATQRKKVFLCDFQTRTHEYYQEAIRRVHAGDIGELAMLEVHCGTEGFADPPKTDTIASRLQGLIWVNDEEIGGGLLVNFDIHAIDVALWIAGAHPVSALGCARRGDPNTHGNAPRVFSLTYQFANGLILAHHAEHVPNLREDGIVCNGFGNAGIIETAYDKKVWIHSNKQSYAGGETTGIYASGMQTNVDTFHKSVTEGIYDNPTIEPSINATLTTILSREAARRNGLLTWDDLLKENRRLEVDVKGLVE
jgi:predicted dehydrogenase